LSKFNSEEAENISIKDLLTFDLEDFVKVKQKLDEFYKVSESLKDKELTIFFNEKMKVNKNF